MVAKKTPNTILSHNMKAKCPNLIVLLYSVSISNIVSRSKKDSDSLNKDGLRLKIAQEENRHFYV